MKKNNIKTLITSVVVFFHRKKIVHAVGYNPSQFYKAVSIKDKPYIRVIQTNITKGANGHPMLDIPVSSVKYIERLASPFQHWVNNLIGRRVYAKAKIYRIQGGYTFKKSKSKK